MASTLLNGQSITFALEAKVSLLRKLETYSDKPEHIDAVETHMSWVFLTDRYAYKMKKPVRYDILDYSTLALRQQDCEEEVRLNRRLAPDVYLGTVPLTVDPDGSVCVNGKGDVIEWLVKMRRLPAERMLDNMIRKHTVHEADIDSLAMVLARFYQACYAVETSHEQYRAEFINGIEINLQELSVPGYGLPHKQLKKIHDVQASFLRLEPGLLDARVDAGKIVEGHGDLRPEHICLEPDPVIIDCLSFNRQFRINDPADELSFLAMECEHLGAPLISDSLFHTYKTITHDDPSMRLVYFYKIFRACLRAQLAISHVRELEKKDWCKWQQSAKEYLNLAEGYCERLSEI